MRCPCTSFPARPRHSEHTPMSFRAERGISPFAKRKGTRGCSSSALDSSLRCATFRMTWLELMSLWIPASAGTTKEALLSFRAYAHVIPSGARNLPPSQSVRGLGGCPSGPTTNMPRPLPGIPCDLATLARVPVVGLFWASRRGRVSSRLWIPACAGMTEGGGMTR